MNRANTNATVYFAATQATNEGRTGAWKYVDTMGEKYRLRRRRVLVTLLTSKLGTPQQQIAFNEITLLPHEGLKLKRKRPKNNWIKKAVEDYWNAIGLDFNTDICNIEFNHNNPRHVAIIFDAAAAGFVGPVSPG